MKCKVDEQLASAAERAYATHEVTQVAPNHWVLRRPNTSSYRQSVYLLEGHIVLMVGDGQECAVQGGYGFEDKSPLRHVKWVSTFRSVRSLAKKALLVGGCNQGTLSTGMEYDPEVACEQLKARALEARNEFLTYAGCDECTCQPGPHAENQDCPCGAREPAWIAKALAAIEDDGLPETQGELLTALANLGMPEYWEWSWGDRPANAFYYLRAACRVIVSALDEPRSVSPPTVTPLGETIRAAMAETQIG